MRQYALVTASYWAFTLTDGALRMLVVLFFHQLGYSPLQIAMLFLFYEFFGMVTNLLGGWVAARFGLAVTLLGGLALQVGALSMLLVDTTMLTVAYVMVAQALSGIAKDLNKMSAKSSVKALAGEAEGRLYRWVAALTGSKNALKGIGFFLGGGLLSWLGFQGGILVMAVVLLAVALVAACLIDFAMGRTRFKPKFSQVLSKSDPVNKLSAARFFLFGARDVWFVVALPVYLQMQLGWSGVQVGTFLAVWIIGYGLVQSMAPVITGSRSGKHPDGRTAVWWGITLAVIPLAIVLAMRTPLGAELALLCGLLMFGAVFAVNSAVHSYLIVSYADADGMTLDVGFYYMSNAAGRLLGTILSGWIYQEWGLTACLICSAVLVAVSSLTALMLPRRAIPQDPSAA